MIIAAALGFSLLAAAGGAVAGAKSGVPVTLVGEPGLCAQTSSSEWRQYAKDLRAGKAAYRAGGADAFLLGVDYFGTDRDGRTVSRQDQMERNTRRETAEGGFRNFGGGLGFAAPYASDLDPFARGRGARRWTLANNVATATQAVERARPATRQIAAAEHRRRQAVLVYFATFGSRVLTPEGQQAALIVCPGGAGREAS